MPVVRSRGCRSPPPGRGSLGRGFPNHLADGGDDRISQVPGVPQCTMPCSSTPARSSGQAFATLGCGLPHYRKRRPSHCRFRGSVTRPGRSLCTLRGLGYPSTFPPRNTRFRLLASFAGRGWIPAGDHREVSRFCYVIFPPRPGLAWRTDSPDFQCPRRVPPCEFSVKPHATVDLSARQR